MVTREDKIRAWPRTKGGRPLFKTTNEAIFYAHLTWDYEREITALNFYYGKLREKLKELREQDEPDLDKMFIIATDAQFYKECIEEMMGIVGDPYTGAPSW